jgi:hypothetical protein
MHLPSNFRAFSRFFYAHNPKENSGRIEMVGKVAIIKQQIDSICISEALLEKAKIAGRELNAARC